MNMGRKVVGAAVLMLCLMLAALAIAETTVTDTMKVIKCANWVSLRKDPSQASQRLKTVPLGALVYHCAEAEKGFVFCEYEGNTGYILSRYLEPLSSSLTLDEEDKRIPLESMENAGERVLDWQDYNIRVVASRIFPDRKWGETLQAGCYIDGEPIWSLRMSLQHKEREPMLTAFMGGRSREPQVVLFSQAEGLRMIDLMTARTLWILSGSTLEMNGAGAAASDDNGTLYVASLDGQTAAAVSAAGELLWKAEIQRDAVDAPLEIRPEQEELVILLSSGRQAWVEYSGEVIGVFDEAPQQSLYTEEADSGFAFGDGTENP